jgi:hypothetical protein
MSEKRDKISRNEIRDSLLRSGYLLESRVENRLREHWGYVETNASYQDPETGKSRELDVYSMAVVKAGPEEYDFIFAVLLIECVNNPQPIALLTKEPLTPFLHHEDIKMAGLPVKIRDAGRSSWQSLADFLGMEDYHHYCQGRVATQYCSFSGKKSGPQKEWFATHEGSHFDALKKLCDATDYFVDRHFKSWKFGNKEWVNVEFYYPLLIVQGELLDARAGKRSVTLKRAPHLQFRRSVVIGGKEQDYQIDVIEERYLSKYLEIVDRELSKTARLLRRRHNAVRDAVGHIVRRARPLRSPEKIRKVMDI